MGSFFSFKHYRPSSAKHTESLEENNYCPNLEERSLKNPIE